MNIKSRIKKLENLYLPVVSQFCGCYRKHWESCLDSAYNNNPHIEIEIYPKPNFENSFCDKCGKPFSDNDIKMEKDFQIIYG